MRRPRKRTDDDFLHRGEHFGGLQPVKWESRVHNGKWGAESNLDPADDSQESFIFTVTNPHDVAVIVI
jgi:hypothetical protein